MKKILVAVPFTEDQKDKLRSIGKDCDFHFDAASGFSDEDIRTANVIIGNISPAKLNHPASLEWMQLNSAGADAYVKEGILCDTTVLTNAKGAYNVSVAEHAMALLMMLEKKLYLCRDAQSRSEWADIASVGSPYGQTVVITGYGNIGRYLAKIIKPLGCKVIGITRTNTSDPGDADEIYTSDRINEILPTADAVVSFLPGTEESLNYYNAEKFALMKPGALLVNCGRGSSVDQDALYDALTSGKLGAAALDVTVPEPLPAESPLWKLENLVITPHSAGGYRMDLTLDVIMKIVSDNLSNYIEGKPLNNIVDKKLGY